MICHPHTHTRDALPERLCLPGRRDNRHQVRKCMNRGCASRQSLGENLHLSTFPAHPVRIPTHFPSRSMPVCLSCSGQSGMSQSNKTVQSSPRRYASKHIRTCSSLHFVSASGGHSSREKNPLSEVSGLAANAPPRISH